MLILIASGWGHPLERKTVMALGVSHQKSKIFIGRKRVNRRQTECNAKFTWVLPRCEGGRRSHTSPAHYRSIRGKANFDMLDTDDEELFIKDICFIIRFILPLRSTKKIAEDYDSNGTKCDAW